MIDRHQDALSMPLDCRDEMPQANAGQQNDNVNLSRNQAMCEIYCVAILFERHFAHRRAHVRDTAMALDQPSHIFSAAAFEGSDSQTVERHFNSRMGLG